MEDGDKELTNFDFI